MAAVPSISKDLDGSDILHIIVKLSDIRPPEWEPQFPFLNPTTVDQVSQSITHIISEGKLQQILPVIRKWCTGKNKPQDNSHTTWIGRSLSMKESIESVLAVCFEIIQDEEDWMRRDTEQQLALCYAVLAAATSSPVPLYPKAGDLCTLLVCRILNLKELSHHHHRFLADVWNSIGALPLKSNLEIITILSERSFLGIEREVLRLGKNAVTSNQAISESFITIVGSTLLEVCSQSSLVFQSVCNLLTHMMVVSGAHPGIQALTKAFICGVDKQCVKDHTDICMLYEESCQVVSALLCMDPNLLPEFGENTLTRSKVLEMLLELPREKAASLLSHRPIWLLFTL